MADHVIEIPVRNPQLFSPEINRQALAGDKLQRAIYSAILALPYVQDSKHQENLKSALCDLLLWDPAA
jgi:hypothetical protein